MIKIRENNDRLIRRMDILEVMDKIGIGTNKTISMSKTMKIIASRKKRIENGIRALWLGSNPHSNGEAFSRFEIDRIAVINEIRNTIEGIIIAIIDEVNISVIYWKLINYLLIKSQVLIKLSGKISGMYHI